jgi:hypothetical protein
LPRGSLIRETLPGTFGGEDWLPDPARDRAAVAAMFYGVDPDTFGRTTVELVVDRASLEAASDLEARLSALGIRVLRVRTETNPGPPAVIVHRGDLRVASIVAGLAGTAVAESTAADGPDRPDLTIQLANATITAPAIPLPAPR